jgi:hypothetical protein
MSDELERLYATKGLLEKILHEVDSEEKSLRKRSLIESKSLIALPGDGLSGFPDDGNVTAEAYQEEINDLLRCRESTETELEKIKEHIKEEQEKKK